MEALNLYNQYKEKTIHGRYLTLEEVLPVLNRLNKNNNLLEIGKSVQGRSIYSYKIGAGSVKLFWWSQMHGNESTTTKAVLDFLNFLNSDLELAQEFLKHFTFLIIPILNPDGAVMYTRENANKVDLNRDSQQLTQPESQLLRKVFEDFQPDFCYNLHDQRTIFGVGDTGKPATVSFLAPSYNDEREINETRLKAINLIVAMNNVLKNYIPGQIGRFDDSFNINCIGDTFQYLGVPTVLFEAGHFPNDYEREETRKYIFLALLASCYAIVENDIVVNKTGQYLNIPQNKINFYDFMVKNIKINYDGNEILTKFAIQYKEQLVEGKVEFIAYIVAIDGLDKHFGHKELDCNAAVYEDENENLPKIDQIANFSINNTVVFDNGVVKNSFF